MKNHHYWFKPKIYGLGFVPISWQGWLLTLFLLITIYLSAYLNNFYQPDITTQQGFHFLFDLIMITTIFTLISLPRTQGKVKWRWGK